MMINNLFSDCLMDGKIFLVMLYLIKKDYSDDSGCYKSKFEPNDSQFFAQIFDVNSGYSVSNKVIIHDAKALDRTNPDPINKRLEKILAKIDTRDLDVLSILEFIDSEDFIMAVGKSKSGSSKNEDHDIEPQNSTDKVLDYEEFTEQHMGSQKNSHHKFGFGESHTLDRIVEFLQRRVQEIIEWDTSPQYEEEESEKDNIDDSEGREDYEYADEQLKSPKMNPTQFKRNQKKIYRFFEKYIVAQKILIDKKFNMSRLDISLFSIILFLLIEFHLKPIKILKKDEDKHYTDKYIKSEGNFFNNQDYCYLIAKIIGQHTVLQQNSSVNTSNQLEQDLLKNTNETAYWYGVFAISLVAIACERIVTYEFEEIPKPKIWIEELFLNLRHCFGIKECFNESDANKHFLP